MDHKKIVNNITGSYLYDPLSQKNEPILIIDLKASVCSFKYEIYSNLGFYLHSSYQKKIEFGSVGNNNNRLIIQLKASSSESHYLVRLFEVQVIGVNSTRLDQGRGGLNNECLTTLQEPIFYFYHEKEKTNPNLSQETIHIKLHIDEVDDKNETNVDKHDKNETNIDDKNIDKNSEKNEKNQQNEITEKSEKNDKT